MSIQRNDRNELIDASAGVDRLRSLLCDQGTEWICTTLAMICGEHEADCTPSSPLQIAWRARGRAFEATSRKMTKIKAEARRMIPRPDDKEGR
jgi:hypothetical protein